eukprot:300839-Hanusia_phi.AAC.2
MMSLLHQISSHMYAKRSETHAGVKTNTREDTGEEPRNPDGLEQVRMKKQETEANKARQGETLHREAR